GCKKTEDLINFLREQEDLGLEDHHFEIFRKEAINGLALLKLNVDKLMQASLGIGPAKNIAEFILDIKGED
ncbi:31377_t:CDS:1, partial [Gigaspora margarita]